MKIIEDQLGRIVVYQSTNKIVSLVPSITELLFDLNLETHVIGRTKFCIHPKELIAKCAVIGGTKNVDIKKIMGLSPDIIIANKEENDKNQIENLSNEIPMFITNVSGYQTALEMIHKIGILTNSESTANILIREINESFSINFKKKKTCVYLIWKDPYMTVGADTFIHSMITKCGYKNLFSQTQRYPITSIEEIISMNPEEILLSSEPYPFGVKHLHQLQKEIPNSKVRLVDGTYFSWYGSRMRNSMAYFKSIENL